MSSLRGVVFVGALLVAGVAGAEELPEGASAYVGVTTNSIFRGVSQTADSEFYHRGGMNGMSTGTPKASDDRMFAPAVFGGLDYRDASGFYAGLAGTGVNIPQSDAVLRVDGFGGYWHRFASGLALDAGAVAYVFPGQTRDDFWEFYIGLGFGPVSGKVFHDPVNDNTYYAGALNFDIGSGVELELHAGHYARDVGPDYDDYLVGVARSFGGWRLGAAVVDTSIDDAIVYAWVRYRFPL